MTIQMATAQTDFYKLFHRAAYAKGITHVYSNFTSRNGKLSNVPNNKEVVFVGLQYFLMELKQEWDETFFNLPKAIAIKAIKRITSNCLGLEYDASHFEALHDLGYLPLEFKALPEGVSVPYGVAPVTFKNTVEGFHWLPNYIETIMSTENWLIQTSATTSNAYLKAITASFERTGMDKGLIPFMCHDFSMRGMAGRHAAAMSGFGHLCNFAGTDTIPAILFAEKYYGADIEKELVGASVPATEHSTVTSFIMAMVEETGCTKLEAEIAYVRYLFEKVETGIVSHVSDSFDFFKFVTEGLPVLKEEILARDGKLVVRPDSGDPVDILCGKASSARTIPAKWSKTFEEFKSSVQDEMDELFSDKLAEDPTNPFSELTERYVHEGKLYEVTYEPDLNRHDKTYYYIDNWGDTDSKFTWKEVEMTPEEKGLVQLLWEQFGGTFTDKGFKLLDEHIGAIYGDSITVQRQAEIIKRLESKGFVPSVILGIGSYSFQYVTRDTHGSAVKATHVIKDGKGVDVCKDPATDSKKKSAKGLLRIEIENGKYVQYDQQTVEQEQQGELKTVFRDGVLLNKTSLSEIRERVLKSL